MLKFILSSIKCIYFQQVTTGQAKVTTLEGLNHTCGLKMNVIKNIKVEMLDSYLIKFITFLLRINLPYYLMTLGSSFVWLRCRLIKKLQVSAQSI